MSVSVAYSSVPGRSGLDSSDAAIIVVESCASVGREIVEQLHADGYRAVVARTAEHARVLARARPVRAIVLGQLEEPRSELDLLDEIRRGCERRDAAVGPVEFDCSAWDPLLPVILLGQGGGRLELLRAFEMGADDFVARAGNRSRGDEPRREGLDYLEFRARLRALLRRSESRPGKRLLCAGPLDIDTDARIVRIGPVLVRLSRLEYELLVHLATNPTDVCSKEELLRTIWKRRDRSGVRTIDSHASRLRRKLAVAGARGLVVNVWGVGYRLL